MKVLKEETSTQKLYWDTENKIVWGLLFGDQKTVEHAKENIDAQERIRDSLKKKKTRVLIDMTAVSEITKEARECGLLVVVYDLHVLGVPTLPPKHTSIDLSLERIQLSERLATIGKGS